MTFEGERCSSADADRSTMTIDGRLTIRGVQQAVQMNMQYRLIDGVLYLRGELGITHRDFGFRPYSAFRRLGPQPEKHDAWIRLPERRR